MTPFDGIGSLFWGKPTEPECGEDKPLDPYEVAEMSMTEMHERGIGRGFCAPAGLVQGPYVAQALWTVGPPIENARQTRVEARRAERRLARRIARNIKR